MITVVAISCQDTSLLYKRQLKLKKKTYPTESLERLFISIFNTLYIRYEKTGGNFLPLGSQS